MTLCHHDHHFFDLEQNSDENSDLVQKWRQELMMDESFMRNVSPYMNKRGQPLV